MRTDLLFFGTSQSNDVAVVAILAIASILFVHGNLLRHTWFLTFLAITSLVQLGLVVAFQGTDLDPNEFRLFLSTDALAQVGLAFALEKLVLLRHGLSPRLSPSCNNRPAGAPRGKQRPDPLDRGAVFLRKANRSRKRTAQGTATTLR